MPLSRNAGSGCFIALAACSCYEPTINSAPLDSGNPAISKPWDDVTLSIHHAFATNHTVTIIEKSCSAILGPFTVPIYGKSNDDVVGMRGYTSFWSLGVMDAVLQSGLVPDVGSPPTPPSSTTVSSDPLVSPGFLQFRNQPIHNPSTAASTATSVEMPPSSSASPVDPKPRRKHPFESKDPHPNDLPTNMPSLDLSITKLLRIDVAARREWIHKLLYYMGTKLGIKKGLGVVYAEGYLEISKREVERLFGS
jgi:hypothetical protein